MTCARCGRTLPDRAPQIDGDPLCHTGPEPTCHTLAAWDLEEADSRARLASLAQQLTGRPA
ncbi:MAG: hypothetical protein JWR88_1040 [Pseudonocardia sp.]|nr:hypothetical protein [Pseudonocardia sp.]